MLTAHFLPLTRLPARFDPVSQPDIQDRLQQALGPAYVIERELGGGGAAPEWRFESPPPAASSPPGGAMGVSSTIGFRMDRSGRSASA